MTISTSIQGSAVIVGTGEVTGVDEEALEGCMLTLVWSTVEEMVGVGGKGREVGIINSSQSSLVERDGTRVVHRVVAHRRVRVVPLVATAIALATPSTREKLALQ